MSPRLSKEDIRRGDRGDSPGDIGDAIEVRARMLSCDLLVEHALGRARAQPWEVVVASDDQPCLNRGGALILAVMVRGLIDGGSDAGRHEQDSAA